jgi:hypothetical protein
VAAVAAEDNVLRLELSKHTHRVRLLPQVRVRGAEKDAFGEVLQHRFFEAADPIKGAVEVVVVGHRWVACGSQARRFWLPGAWAPNYFGA